MNELIKTFFGLAAADSRFDKIVVAAKEAVLILIAVQAVLTKAQELINAFLAAAPVK